MSIRNVCKRRQISITALVNYYENTKINLYINIHTARYIVVIYVPAMSLYGRSVITEMMLR